VTNAGKLPSGSISRPQFESGEPVGKVYRLAASKPSYVNLPGPGNSVSEVESPPGSSLLGLEQIALASNPAIQQASAQISSLQGEKLQASLKPNPTFGYSGGEVGNEGRAGQQGVYFGREFESQTKRNLRMCVVDAEIAAATALLQIQEQRVLTDVRQRYYQVLVSQQKVQVLGDFGSQIESSAEIAQKLYEGREVTRIAALQSALQVKNLMIARNQADNELQAAYASLAAVCGMADGLTTDGLSGNPDPEPDVLNGGFTLQRILESSPEITRASLMLDRNQREVARQKGELIRNVDLQSTLNYDNNSDYMISNLQITIPIQVNNRNQGNIRAATARVQAAGNAIDKQVLDLKQRFAQAEREFQNAQFQIAQYRNEILPAAEDVLGLASEGFRAGEASYLELLTAQRSLLDAKLGYLDSLQGFWTAKALLDGNLLQDSLAN